MVNPKDNPIEWAQLGYELKEAKEHLESLLSQFGPEGGLDEEDLQIQIFHVITHLNRVYNSRNHIGEMSHDAFVNYSEVPGDFRASG